MSENIPISSSQSATSLNVPRKKSKRKHEKIKLPTPPPDPTGKTDKENDFIEYLNILQKNTHPTLGRSASLFTPAIVAEDAFDHLEKLYKLMEQMLILREQNARLHRRVRDLEHLSNIQKMQKQLQDNVVIEDAPDLDKDTAFAETILESILSGSKREVRPKLTPRQSRLRQSILRRPSNRNSSIMLEKSYPLDGNLRRSSATVYGKDKSAKVSKWTKVKAAFKWEKASPTVGDAKSQDSGISGMVPVNLEVARYLRVPSTSDDCGHSPADSGAAEISTPGSLSTTSSNDDFLRNDLRSRSEHDFHSSDEDRQHFHIEYIPHSKEEQLNSQKASSKSHRTPWAMMKDIIQTRNSFKKRHRLSAKSDDVMPEEATGTDFEDVFEDDAKSTTVSQASPSPIQPSPIPPEIVARYQQVIAEDDLVPKGEGRKISKWTRVKKAFLTSYESKGSVTLQEEENRRIQAEIDKNYKQLKKKISLEFHEKIQEWEKNKTGTQMNPIASTSSYSPTDENHSPAFMKKMEEWQKIKSQPSIKQRPNLQLQSEENLPPEFRKKLQEWQKIKKSSEGAKKKLGDRPKWKSISGRSENIHTEYPQLSDDFIKKLEAWKQIKAGLNDDQVSRRLKDKKERTPSPRMNRKESSLKQIKKNKDQTDQELQWFEKELSKIEKEKQRLERERLKFLEREERLTKLQRSVIGSNKKEVLVHTPCGFYKFEGISRKFTQKLYEWEKARGIAPEASTFALLTSSCVPEVASSARNALNTLYSASLPRSKSADSIVTSALNLTCPLMSHQLSSLSLNDVENLEKECLSNSKASSLEFIGEDIDEPEALIVEVEDIVEETAAPLQDYVIKQQTPIYQREGIKNMCEGETCIAPKIRRSESTRAQTNYNLIEDIVKDLKILLDAEVEVQKTSTASDTIKDKNKESIAGHKMFKEYFEKQKKILSGLVDKITRLQEANSTVALNIVNEETKFADKHLVDTLETVQDLTLELLQMAEQIDVHTQNRTDAYKQHNRINSHVNDINQMISKILELRRLLSYVCAASDLTAPSHKLPLYKKQKGVLKKSRSSDSKDDKSKPSVNFFVKNESGSMQSQGAIKKRIRYRQKTLQSRINHDDSDDEERDCKKDKHKKVTRTRSISESSTVNQNISSNSEIVIDPNIIEKVVVPTEPNFVRYNEKMSDTTADSPVTVFVKTTRKLFTPLIESTIVETPRAAIISNTTQISKNETENTNILDECDVKTDNIKVPIPSRSHSLSRLPPLPASPTTQRKLAKEISPSIRIMLVKYNQKLQEQEGPAYPSGGSSGSASPVAWRSPTSERRVKVQTERYQEELNKLSPLLGGRREVQKSASVGVLNGKQVTLPQRKLSENLFTKNQDVRTSGITKSSSASIISSTKTNEVKETINLRKPSSLKVNTIKDGNVSPDIRSKRLQKAKEDFLRSGSISAPPTSSDAIKLKFPVRNRLSQISVGSESSYDSSACDGVLIKSASAGMINIDADTYRQINPEVHMDGYVSLPRTYKKTKEGFLGGKFAFSNIASKFRKVRMRRGRDKMNTISTLCRQSLVVDISNAGNDGSTQSSDKIDTRTMGPQDISSEEVSSETVSRSGSWIKRSGFFK